VGFALLGLGKHAAAVIAADCDGGVKALVYMALSDWAREACGRAATLRTGRII